MTDTFFVSVIPIHRWTVPTVTIENDINIPSKCENNTKVAFLKK